MKRGDKVQGTGRYVGTDNQGIIWVCYQQDDKSFARMCAAYDAKMGTWTNCESFREPQKMSYAVQRKLFGFPIFGKMTVYWQATTAEWRVRKQVAFGLDYACGSVSHWQAINLASRGKKVQVG